MFQQTPRAVTPEPPSLVIFPPLETVVSVIEEASVVVREGVIAEVVKLTSSFDSFSADSFYLPEHKIIKSFIDTLIF